jgi:hypothetical protein
LGRNPIFSGAGAGLRAQYAHRREKISKYGSLSKKNLGMVKTEISRWTFQQSTNRRFDHCYAGWL